MAKRTQSGSDDGAAPVRPEAVQLRARRSPRLVAFGVLVVVLGALGGATLYSNVARQESAVAMARDVHRGQVITRDDLTIVEIPAGFTVETTGGNDMGNLVGQRALTDLPAGSFPASHHLGDPPLPEGHSLVGLNLPPGRIPVAELPQGTVIDLISLDNDMVVRGTVARAPALSEDGTGMVVDVAVPADKAGEIARLSARDMLALVAVGGQ